MAFSLLREPVIRRLIVCSSRYYRYAFHLEVLRLVGELEGGVVAGVDDVVVLLDGRHGLGDQVGVVGRRGNVVVTLDRLPAQRPVGQVLE